MKIIYHPTEVSKTLLSAFTENNLIFGTGSQYGSLLSPSSSVLTHREQAEINQDLKQVWELYRICNELYLASLRGMEPDWIRYFTEHRLSDHKVRVQRLVARERLEPLLTRIDYVSLGVDRKIAEIQWKSGGLGLFSGIQNVYAKNVDCPGTEILGDLAGNILELIKASAREGDTPAALNSLNYVWLKSEFYLRELAAKSGVMYFPVHLDELPFRILERNSGYFAIDGGALHRIHFLYGREFGEMFMHGLTRLAKAALDGKIWVETPLNYLYRQKWALALPFMDRYKDLFSENLTSTLIPTVLLNGPDLDLKCFGTYFEPSEAEKLAGVKTIRGLADLPGSLRRSLVIKCGAGRGGFHSHGKGVFRISGSRNSAAKTLDMVKTRMDEEAEPWIMQKYIHETYEIAVSPPDDLERLETIPAHARFMIFGGNFPTKGITCIGGLGNYGRYWKVSGRSPSINEKGEIAGTVFNDMRVSKSSGKS